MTTQEEILKDIEQQKNRGVYKERLKIVAYLETQKIFYDNLNPKTLRTKNIKYNIYKKHLRLSYDFSGELLASGIKIKGNINIKKAF